MKRLIIIATLMLVAIVPMRAQEWVFKTIEADELRGTESDSVAIFVTDKYSVMVSFTENAIYVRSTDCIFDYHKAEYYIMLGIYDGDGNMVSKQRIFCYYYSTNSRSLIKISNSHHVFNPNHPGDTVVTRSIEHLQKENGYIRIIAPMYLCEELEIIIPCFNNEKKSNK